MSKGIGEKNSFAFTTGAYGNRPTFILTRNRIDDRHEITLYELAPRDIATARRERFKRAQRSVCISMCELRDSIVNKNSPSEILGAGDTIYDWDDWCAIRIATLRGGAFNEVSFLIESVFRELDLDPEIVCTGEPASVSLPEAAGVRLSIAFRAMKPVKRRDRLREMARKIEQMSLGECYYWHAKARSPTSPSGVKALRTLLADHIK